MKQAIHFTAVYPDGLDFENLLKKFLIQSKYQFEKVQVVSLNKEVKYIHLILRETKWGVL